MKEGIYMFCDMAITSHGYTATMIVEVKDDEFKVLSSTLIYKQESYQKLNEVINSQKLQLERFYKKSITVIKDIEKFY